MSYTTYSAYRFSHINTEILQILQTAKPASSNKFHADYRHGLATSAYLTVSPLCVNSWVIGIYRLTLASRVPPCLADAHCIYSIYIEPNMQPAVVGNGVHHPNVRSQRAELASGVMGRIVGGGCYTPYKWSVARAFVVCGIWFMVYIHIEIDAWWCIVVEPICWIFWTRTYDLFMFRIIPDGAEHIPSSSQKMY